jgi:uncharacterized protein with HEPN domain
MSTRDEVSISDMFDHATEAISLLGSKTVEDLEHDRVLQLALTRLFEIIGEAANRVSPTTQEKHPEIPWRPVIGMRNRLIHGYDVIDYQLLWATVSEDLPPLAATLGHIIDEAAS